MTSAVRYSLLESLMLRSRALGAITEEQLDALLSEMDTFWNQMTNEERQEADRRAAALAAIPAPDDLPLHDVSTREGDRLMPREAA